MPKATNTVLVKLRPTSGLRAAESRANLRPLYDTPQATAAILGLNATPQWFMAELPDAPENPWDLAHARVADQLGIAESDVVFAEPDIIHDIYADTNEEPFARGLGAAPPDCTPNKQDPERGKPLGPKTAWHLDDGFTQLASARAAVEFRERRTRIAHIDTGYFRSHISTPANILTQLERNFVSRDGNPGSAQDPDNHLRILDNSGHGTGTLSILAGGSVNLDGTQVVMGGAPGADIVPIRIADSVVLLRTSALAQALLYTIEAQCDVITMSLGGLPSRAWAEAVDKLYEAGIVFCAAAGNHTGPLPPRVVVYPARYPRVIAVAGVMANHEPYTGLKDRALEGSFGPERVMEKALAAYTPNIPWARFGCANVIRLNGEGTSSATPQVAAAAALWLEKYKSVLPRNHQRVEAVRHALFTSAKEQGRKLHFGNGILQARAALDVQPRLGMPKSDESRNSFAFLRLLTGLGINEVPPREEMYNVELTQRWLMNEELQRIAPDPDTIGQLEGAALKEFMEAAIGDPEASKALRTHLANRYPVAAGRSVPRTKHNEDVVAEVLPACGTQPELRDPVYRRLRVYAVDPSLSTRLDTAGVNEVVLNVPWEKLGPGPKGEYLEVEDIDAKNTTYAPVNLDDPRLLARDGWRPSEGNPQFHQQMVYAVAMKTIDHFERALGRPVLWKQDPGQPFVQRLGINPHALRQANAFYSPFLVALQFGYFEAAANDPGNMMPGSRVYSCLSHDIIAHETTHAILDGMQRRFNEPTNVDVLAFHEAFADIVALLQHFTIPEVLESEIARTRGNLEAESMLGMLAIQFGNAMGGRAALRNAIGRMEDGVWKRFEPDPEDLKKRVVPHSRGAVLVAAVFDAFIAIYNTRIADLLRIYTGGTGVLPNGSIHPDLVHRLADEAAKCASHVLNMCIRAVDYLPPVDVTFFEYLRALITADFDVVSDDRLNYRVAFVEAFRRRAIYPLDLDRGGEDTPRTLSVDMLRWSGDIDLTDFKPEERKAIQGQYRGIVKELKQYAGSVVYIQSRKELATAAERQRGRLKQQLTTAFTAVPSFAQVLGVDPSQPFEVQELRSAMRSSPSGRTTPQVIVSLTQSITVPATDETPAHVFHGGSTLVVDLTIPEIRYAIIKNIKSKTRPERTAAFVRESAADPLRALFFAPDRKEPFAALHALADEGL
jgi:hypothetical protein